MQPERAVCCQLEVTHARVRNAPSPSWPALCMPPERDADGVLPREVTRAQARAHAPAHTQTHTQTCTHALAMHLAPASHCRGAQQATGLYRESGSHFACHSQRGFLLCRSLLTCFDVWGRKVAIIATVRGDVTKEKLDGDDDRGMRCGDVMSVACARSAPSSSKPLSRRPASYWAVQEIGLTFCMPPTGWSLAVQVFDDLL